MLQYKLAYGFALTALLGLIGCGNNQKEPLKTFDRKDAQKAPVDPHGSHEHGPHEGHVIELGNEEYHAEVVDDHDKDELGIYILGGDAKTAKPVELTELVLTFKHGDKTEEFKLPAVKQEGDPEGKASFFKIKSQELFEELHHHSEGATLTFKVGETELKGTVKHEH